MYNNTEQQNDKIKSEQVLSPKIEKFLAALPPEKQDTELQNSLRKVFCGLTKYGLGWGLALGEASPSLEENSANQDIPPTALLKNNFLKKIDEMLIAFQKNNISIEMLIQGIKPIISDYHTALIEASEEEKQQQLEIKQRAAIPRYTPRPSVMDASSPSSPKTPGLLAKSQSFYSVTELHHGLGTHLEVYKTFEKTKADIIKTILDQHFPDFEKIQQTKSKMRLLQIFLQTKKIEMIKIEEKCDFFKENNPSGPSIGIETLETQWRQLNQERNTLKEEYFSLETEHCRLVKPYKVKLKPLEDISQSLKKMGESYKKLKDALTQLDEKHNSQIKKIVSDKLTKERNLRASSADAGSDDLEKEIRALPEKLDEFKKAAIIHSRDFLALTIFYMIPEIKSLRDVYLKNKATLQISNNTISTFYSDCQRRSKELTDLYAEINTLNAAKALSPIQVQQGKEKVALYHRLNAEYKEKCHEYNSLKASLLNLHEYQMVTTIYCDKLKELGIVDAAKIDPAQFNVYVTKINELKQWLDEKVKKIESRNPNEKISDIMSSQPAVRHTTVAATMQPRFYPSQQPPAACAQARTSYQTHRDPGKSGMAL